MPDSAIRLDSTPAQNAAVCANLKAAPTPHAVPNAARIRASNANPTPAPKTYLCSFADSRLCLSALRFSAQARALGAFEELLIYDENSLDLPFRAALKNAVAKTAAKEAPAPRANLNGAAIIGGGSHPALCGTTTKISLVGAAEHYCGGGGREDSRLSESPNLDSPLKKAPDSRRPFSPQNAPQAPATADFVRLDSPDSLVTAQDSRRPFSPPPSEIRGVSPLRAPQDSAPQIPADFPRRVPQTSLDSQSLALEKRPDSPIQASLQQISPQKDSPDSPRPTPTLDSPPLSSVRGFGYWAWKPQVILQSLEQIAEGDYLVYADIGCTWGRGEAARQKLREMLFRVESAAGFCIEGCLEFQWTKGDVFAHFGALERPEITHTPQVAATFIFMKKCEKTLKIIESWRQIALENFELITDSPSRAPNFAGFVENRHDQSLWSVLNKIHRLENFAFSELRGADAVLRDARAKFPIHPRAHTWGLLALSLYIFATALNIYRWRFVHFLKRLKAYARAKCKALCRKIRQDSRT